ncbi:lipopolysaccharide assembly LapA domain-containing protein [Rhodoferax sp.]|jgi:putative membrane protein|uniref:LapA family protein n=1 Tax=Rhodoferax sp. TaxID=50421 RepID=UPI0025ED5534|nr:LapA family protein [Rhodoferax sp.]
MKQIAWLFKWLLKAAIFFTLFAFALNNQGDATVYFFFGTRWTAPMVLVVLSAFAAGLLIGVLGMVPRWWRHRSAARHARSDADSARATLAAETNATPLVPPHGL